MKTPSTHSSPRPRNPLVAAARFRQAGSHRRSRSALRQSAARALRRELASPVNTP